MKIRLALAFSLILLLGWILIVVTGNPTDYDVTGEVVWFVLTLIAMVAIKD